MELKFLKDKEGDIIKCYDCQNPATCIIWNDFMGELPSCELHKASLSQIASYAIHEDGTFTKTLTPSQFAPRDKEFPRYEL